MSSFLEYSSAYDPYSTSVTKYTSVQPIKIALGKLDSMNVDKTYGIDFGYEIEPFIITGKDKEEESIPPFELPIIFTTGRGTKSIGIDLREYVNSSIKNKNVESYTDLMSVLPRHDAANTLFRMGSIMAALLSGDVGKIPRDEYLIIYSCLFTSVIGSIVRLDPDDELFCKVILAMWAYIITSNIDYNEIDMNLVIKIIADKLKLSTNARTLNWIRDSVLKVNISISNLKKEEYKTLRGLCRVFQENLIEEAGKFFNVSIFSNQMSNLWFGPGKSEAGRASMECIPVFLAIAESSLAITSYKTSRLSQILNKNTKLINKNEFIKKMERNFPIRP